jgi:ferrochelatase
MPPYDAFLLVSFGGPEGPGEVIPFLQNVTRGRAVPPGRLDQVAEHYYRFGGISPINQQCRDLAAAIEKDFAASGISLPVYWGNRNWRPYLADTLRAMTAAGVRRALAFVTSGYSSFSSCRQYLDDIDRAVSAAGPGAPAVDKIRQYFNHPGYIEPFAAAAITAIESLPQSVKHDVDLVFTAHSIPSAMAAASGPAGDAYPAQLAEAAALVAERVPQARSWRLAYSSRSGPPSQSWLEPDVSDSLAELAAAGSGAAVVVPVGFICDHMEVKFDLDVAAAQTAQRLGLPFRRAATPGTDPRFVAMVTELVRERTESAPPRALGRMRLTAGFCQNGCCTAGPAAPGGLAGAGEQA